MSDAQDELQLGDVLHRYLLHVLAPHGNSLQGKVRQFHIPKLEDPVPGNQHVLKHGKGVHFVVAAGQGVVIQRLAKVVGLPAYKFQPGRVYGDRETHAVFSFILGIDVQRPVNRTENFIGKRRQRRQLLGAPYNDSIIGGVHHAHRGVLIGQLADRQRPVNLGMPEGMGQAKVALSHVFVVLDQVVPVAVVVAAVQPRHLAHRCKLNIYVIWRPSQHPEGISGHDFQRPSPSQQVLLGLGDDVGQCRRFAAGRGLEAHVVLVFGLVLQVVNAGQGCRHAG